jgi:hypothetical protein
VILFGGGENQDALRKCPVATLSKTDLTCSVVGLDPSLRGENAGNQILSFKLILLLIVSFSCILLLFLFAVRR